MPVPAMSTTSAREMSVSEWNHMRIAPLYIEGRRQGTSSIGGGVLSAYSPLNARGSTIGQVARYFIDVCTVSRWGALPAGIPARIPYVPPRICIGTVETSGDRVIGPT